MVRVAISIVVIADFEGVASRVLVASTVAKAGVLLARPLTLGEAVAVDDLLAICKLDSMIISVVVGHEFGILLQQVFLVGAPLKDQAISTIVSTILVIIFRVADPISSLEQIARFAPLELPCRCIVLVLHGSNERKKGKKGNGELHDGTV